MLRGYFHYVYIMQIVDNKALQFVTKKHAQITALIPRAAVLAEKNGKAQMLVHWGEDEWRVLRNLGIKDPPHPILGRYKWPGVYTPFEHQRSTAAFLASNTRAFCLSEPGTGKTSAAAWAADYLMKLGKVKRVLIICPLSIMDTAWRADLFRTVMHRRVAIATGSREKREAVINSNAEFVIINFDGVKVVTAALQAGGFDLIIIDEATALKTATTDRWKAVAALLQPTTRVWAMTGTPAAQSPMDAYGMAKLVRPESVPRSVNRWRDRVMQQITSFKWVPKVDAKDKVFEVLQPAIRFTKEECLDLPELLYTTRDVPLTPQQKKYYNLIKQEMVAVAAGEELTAVNAAGLMNKLLQISAGASYTTTKEVIEFDASNRLSELTDIIDSTDHKVLVFVAYRHVMQMLKDKLTTHLGDPHAVEIIQGGVSAGARAETIKRFQTEDRPKVLLLAPQAAGHGITLTRADQIVWWGPIPSVELYLQCNARAHRAGQRNCVTVTHLQGSPVEARVYKALQGKVNDHMDIVAMYKEEIA